MHRSTKSKTQISRPFTQKKWQRCMSWMNGNLFFYRIIRYSPCHFESNHNVNLHALSTAKNRQTTRDTYRMDRSKAYGYNLWHASIQTRWTDATLALWWIATASKLLKNQTRKRRKKILLVKKSRSKVVTLGAVGHDNVSFVLVF